MIVLNVDKELVTVANWADIESRPGFTANLDPAEHKLRAIIGRYVIQDQVPCGLSNCHRPHAKGYLVVTESGRETNIGHDCGRTYFGVDFDTMSATFLRDIEEKENRARLFSFSFRVDALVAKIHDLRTQQWGADWIFKQSRSLVETGKDCPTPIVRRVCSMVKARDPMLTRSREATDREVEGLEVAQGRRLPRPQYIEEGLAEIDGLEALYPEYDLRKRLVLELQEDLKSFGEKDIDSLTPQQLRNLARSSGSVDSTLDAVDLAMTYGRRLLTVGDLQPLAQLLTERKDIAVFERYLKAL